MNEGIRDHSTGLNRVDEDAQSIRSTSHASPEEPHAINDRFDSLESRILVVEHSDAELSRRLHSAVATLDAVEGIVSRNSIGVESSTSPNAIPVLAITSFLRWWGSLFYLHANSSPVLSCWIL